MKRAPYGSVPWLTKTFAAFNQKHFKDELLSAELLVTMSEESYFTAISNSHARIVVRADHPFQMKGDLLHEMVHMSLWAEDRPYGHTKEFWKRLKKLLREEGMKVVKRKIVEYANR